MPKEYDRWYYAYDIKCNGQTLDTWWYLTPMGIDVLQEELEGLIEDPEDLALYYMYGIIEDTPEPTVSEGKFPVGSVVELREKYETIDGQKQMAKEHREKQDD